MCIAIYSPMGTETPSEQYLHTSWENNPDGAGFAFNTDDGRVKILKGFMTWESFLETYKKYRDECDFKNRGVLIHFRISTHGGICPECTHPFPLTSDNGTLQKLTATSNYAVIHNGIISLTAPEARTLQHMSDTMVFVSKYLSKIAQYKKWFDNPVTWELIYQLADSKLAVLQGDGSIKATYGFTQDADGNFYSNATYKEERVRYSYKYPYASGYPYTSSYSGTSRAYYYDDDDDDDYYANAHPKSTSPDTKTGKAKHKEKTHVTALMKLEPGQILNAGAFSYAVDDDGLYFVDSNGTSYFLYQGDTSLIKDKYISGGLMVFSEGCCVTSANGEPVPFAANYWAKTSAIYY